MMSLWKDEGEITQQGHVMGDASAATHGLRKGETLEYELVVGSREGSVT